MKPFAIIRITLFWVLCALIGLHFQVRAQPSRTDSLEKRIEATEEPKAKVDLMNELSWVYRFSDLEKSKKYTLSAIELAEANNYIKGWSSGYNTLALLENDAGKSEQAIPLFDKAFGGKQQIDDRKGMAMIMNNKGVALVHLGRFGEALKCYEYALKYRLEVGDKKGIGDCYNQLGNLARNQGNYAESLAYFQKSLAIRLEINDKRGIAYSYVNMAANYSDQADYLKAIENIQKAIPILEEIKDRGSLVTAFNNLGVANKFLKNYPEAIRYNQEAIRISKETGFTRMSINAWKSLGDIYLEMKNTTQARHAFETCLGLAEEAKSKGDIAHCYSGLALCFEREKDLKSAAFYFHKGTEWAENSGVVRDIIRLNIQEANFLIRTGGYDEAQILLNKSLPIAKNEGLKLPLSEIYRMQALIHQHKNPETKIADTYFEKYARLKDSIYKDDLPRQFAEQQTRFQTERKEAALRLSQQKEKIARLELEAQAMELQKRNMALALSIMAFLGMGLSGYFYNRKQRADARVRENLASRRAEEAERIRLAKDIHDEFGSGLTKIRFITEMVIEKAGGQGDWAALLAPVSKTATSLVDNMRDLIWVLNPANNTLDILVARIREYTNEYMDDFGIEVRFEIPDEIAPKPVSKEMHRNILMVVKEALQNITKHSGARVVDLRFVLDKDFELQITDDGQGFDPTIPGKGNGRLNMSNRIQQLGGNLEVSSSLGKGSSIHIRVPLPEMA